MPIKHSKRYRNAVKVADLAQEYPLKDAVDILAKFPKAKFDETVELSFHLGVDATSGEQNVRGTTPLPNGSGKKVRVLVFTDDTAKALAAGADFAGLQDLMAKIQGGWLDFDVAIATNEAMKTVRTLARVLGPKGLMPNPKAGTVTDDIAAGIKAVKAGRVEFKMDKTANIGVGVGKRSFTPAQILENATTVLEAVGKAIRRLYRHLCGAMDGAGMPHPVLQAFGRHLHEYLLDRGVIEDVEDYDPACLKVFSRQALALLESPRIAGGLLQRLPELRAALPASVTAGPYDANRVGLVFPEGGRATAVAQLRRLKAVLPDGPVRAGVAELGRETGEPEVLLQAALAGLRPLQEMTRPALLLHDDDGAVNDTLAYVLGRDFELEKSTSLEQAQQLLRTRSFDGLITEVELRGASGLELARLARELQPGIRPFFTTIAELPAATAGTADLADAVVFQKPFDARALAQTVREKLGLGDAVARTE